MKITNPLDKILDNEAKVKILRFLYMTGAQWNGRQIAKEIKVTPATAHKALRSLNKEGILLLRNIGKTHVYVLDEDNLIFNDMFKPLFAKEGQILHKVIEIIKRKIASSKIKKHILNVSIFGSVTARKDHAESDIDLAIIVDTAGCKAAIERLFEDMDIKISGQFGNTVAPYINTRAELRTKYAKGLRIINNILEGYTLYGKDLKKLL